MAEDFFSGIARGLSLGHGIQDRRAVREQRALQNRRYEEQLRLQQEDRARAAKGREALGKAYSTDLNTRLDGNTLSGLATLGVDPSKAITTRESLRTSTREQELHERKLKLEDEQKFRGEIGSIIGTSSMFLSKGHAERAQQQWELGLAMLDEKGIYVPPEQRTFNPENLEAAKRRYAEYGKELEIAKQEIDNATAVAEAADVPAKRAHDKEMRGLDLSIKKSEAELKRLKLQRGGLTEKESFEQENKLRDEYNALSKDFRSVVDSIARLDVAANFGNGTEEKPLDQDAANKSWLESWKSTGEAPELEPNGASDLAIIFSYMKILDPTSVVRGDEQASAANTSGVPDSVRNIWNQVLTGQKLTPTQRKNFIEVGSALGKRKADQHKKLVDSYGSLAKRYGLNPENVVTDFTAVPSGDGDEPPRAEKKTEAPPPPQFAPEVKNKAASILQDGIVGNMKTRGGEPINQDHIGLLLSDPSPEAKQEFDEHFNDPGLADYILGF